MIKKRVYIVAAVLYAVAAVVSFAAGDGGLHRVAAGLHGLFAAALLLPVLPVFRERVLGAPHRRYLYSLIGELLLILSAAIAGFRYFYALNANLDYVQRFMEHSGRIQLALDSTQERLQVLAEYGPLAAAGIIFYILWRVALPGEVAVGYRDARTGDSRLLQWSLPVVLLSAAAAALALPSGLALQGVPILAWVAMVPLFILLDRLPFMTAWRYGVVWGLTYLILTNYWLATFSLVSLQTAVLIYVGYYFLFFPVIISARLVGGRWRFLLMAAAFVLFDYLRTLGFLGYPWALLAHSQYRFPVVFQVAEITGFHGVGMLLFTVNALLAQLLLERRRFREWRTPVAAGLVLLGGSLAFGVVRIAQAPGVEGANPESTVRVALIQQNTDPRQANFYYTFGILEDLTREAMQHEPELVVWGETAFVPNIRRWSDPEQPPGIYTPLVRDFLEFQADIGTALLTGNDDYRVVRDEQGQELDRLHFNSAVLFDANGQRGETYHKIRLVPFTEYFPMGEIFPAALELLESYGVDFWEPGEERVVFDFAPFSFSTPICFEDVFPQEVREFVLAGADVILNITNDYWSLNPVQAEQHYAGSVFRTVENRRPMLRGTVSGKTAYLDSYGRLRAALPVYERDYLVVDFDPELEQQRTTLYTAWGDWFPLVLALLLLAAAVRWVLQQGSRRQR
ncbi:apolipoprotein N-acyltransferase [Spirochaeta africana]|uniref:Apolipoprotein N-acyltransferase n=1 Tax=Spirochaeta africana (strain ATCC 700263 / DSM 8902 / Z-7692) TaxID=889378 RepID=H9UMR3_SPIAZ|nr:apolipoprotein N-acyltransferase [Spirochaeta africana]AFG38806.1 apolipoprotein N-acyltransferase [Spirochaeta africana DSM 8902]